MPSSTSSGTPKTAGARTGVPNAIASSIERGSDSTSEARMNASAAKYQSSIFGVTGTRRTRPSRPKLRTRAWTAGGREGDGLVAHHGDDGARIVVRDPREGRRQQPLGLAGLVGPHAEDPGTGSGGPRAARAHRRGSCGRGRADALEVDAVVDPQTTAFANKAAEDASGRVGLEDDRTCLAEDRRSAPARSRRAGRRRTAGRRAPGGSSRGSTRPRNPEPCREVDAPVRRCRVREEGVGRLPATSVATWLSQCS